MRIFKSTLIAATLGLAALSIYLASSLVAERGRMRDAAQQRSTVEVRIQRAATARTPAATTTSSKVTPSKPTLSAAPAASARADDEVRGYPREVPPAVLLQAYTEPARRAHLRITQREEERVRHPGLARELGLSEDESDELFTILAEQSLEHDERIYRNEISGRRELIDPGVLDAATRAELIAFLGAEKFRALLGYRERLPELLRIRELENRLGPEDGFTGAQASQLNEAMRLERATFEPEIRKLGGAVEFRSGYPEDAWLRDAEPVPKRLQFAAEQIPRAASFYARIRARASAFLTPAQLDRLQQVQEERLMARRASIVRGRYLAAPQEALRQAEAAASAK
jgi:hypothetical protein